MDARQWHDLLVEAAGLLRGRGPLLGQQRELALLLTTDAIALGDDLRGVWAPLNAFQIAFDGRLSPSNR